MFKGIRSGLVVMGHTPCQCLSVVVNTACIINGKRLGDHITSFRVGLLPHDAEIRGNLVQPDKSFLQSQVFRRNGLGFLPLGIQPGCCSTVQLDPVAGLIRPSGTVLRRIPSGKYIPIAGRSLILDGSHRTAGGGNIIVRHSAGHIGHRIPVGVGIEDQFGLNCFTVIGQVKGTLVSRSTLTDRNSGWTSTCIGIGVPIIGGFRKRIRLVRCRHIISGHIHRHILRP